MADALDLVHSYVTDGADPGAQAEMEAAFASQGHAWRQTLDRKYMRRTWGMGDADAKLVADAIRPKRP